MKRTSEKKHWDGFWAASRNLDDVYGTDRRIVENLLRHVDVKELSVLEVGAGTGRDAGELASLGARVTALDYSEESLSLMSSARRRPGARRVRRREMRPLRRPRRSTSCTTRGFSSTSGTPRRCSTRTYGC